MSLLVNFRRRRTAPPPEEITNIGDIVRAVACEYPALSVPVVSGIVRTTLLIMAQALVAQTKAGVVEPQLQLRSLGRLFFRRLPPRVYPQPTGQPPVRTTERLRAFFTPGAAITDELLNFGGTLGREARKRNAHRPDAQAARAVPVPEGTPLGVEKSR